MSTRLAPLLLIIGAMCYGPALRADIAVTFSKDEIALIRDYYLVRGLPDADRDGKKNQKGLPPGIARNLARGKPLPPGIAKQYLPDELIRALPPVRSGYERVVVDGRVLLVEVATQIVRDVLYDIVVD
jgi:hypothetical protein